MSLSYKTGSILVMVLAFSPACKSENPTTTAHALAPERVGAAGDAAAAVKVGVLGQGGGTRLTIDLERAPGPNESASLTTCWTIPSDDFALGRAVCKNDAQKSVEITGDNVTLTCVSNPAFVEIKAKHPLSLDFCPSYDVFAYQFKPAFNIKVEN